MLKKFKNVYLDVAKRLNNTIIFRSLDPRDYNKKAWLSALTRFFTALLRRALAGVLITFVSMLLLSLFFIIYGSSTT